MAEININEAVISQTAQVIVDITDQVIRESRKPRLDELRVAARNYLDIITKDKQEINMFESIAKRQKAIRHTDPQTPELVEEYKKNKERNNLFLKGVIPREVYTATFSFQKLINEYIGQHSQMIYVYRKGKGDPILFELEETDIMSFDESSSQKLVARLSMTGKQAKQFEAAGKRLDLEKFRANTAGLNATYKEVIARFNYSKARPRLVMWINPSAPPKWAVMSVSAEGDINEAYSAWVFLRPEEPFDKDMEGNIDIYMGEVANVDNESGLLKGDISVVETNMEYAIKSGKASALSINQVEELARMVMDIDFDESKVQALKQKLHEVAVTRNFKGVGDSVEEALKNAGIEKIKGELEVPVYLGG